MEGERGLRKGERKEGPDLIQRLQESGPATDAIELFSDQNHPREKFVDSAKWTSLIGFTYISLHQIT